jgi:nucleoside-diphosphate-sugar epimerase
LNQSKKTPRYVVLGHKGFLGQSICNSLLKTQSLVTTIPNRINAENLQEIAAKYFMEDTVVINCIASGVTPYSSSETEDFFVNSELLEGLLNFFTQSKSICFLQFGTIYETDDEVNVLSDRFSYVNSKALGSQITKKFGDKDTRVKLMYLPTILGPNQTKGRFFVDFARCAASNMPFRIHYPNSVIKIAIVDSLFRYICDVLDSTNKTVYQLPSEATMSVIEFAKLLNMVLIKNGYPPVQVLISEPQQIIRNEFIFYEDFIQKIERILLDMLENLR